jgi:hypothetical protein
MTTKPQVTHLGHWPVYAFTDEDQAATWAAQERPNPRVVWGVLSIELGPELVGQTIPSQHVLIAKPIEDQ